MSENPIENEPEPAPEPVEITHDLTWAPIFSWIFVFIAWFIWSGLNARRDGGSGTPEGEIALVLVVICLAFGVGYGLVGIRRGGWIDRVVSILSLALLVPATICLAYEGIVHLWLNHGP
ncbi:MAG: hypothetical protein K8S99_01615 [Planctomycetes bacterium]|nr:hypothetical protein [Planctomycetota bacterium]